MVASKTFQVSRNPQYKRGKPRPPLASLELSQSKHGSGGHHWSITGDHYYSEPGEQKCLGSLQSAADQERRHDVHNNSPVVLLVPAAKLMDSGGPRLTFFVSKKVVSEDVDVGEKVKKPPFTSATVTKGKAPAEVGSPGGRRTKKSRRRLLEKTTEFSDSSSSQSDSCSDTPSLPVIDTGAGSTLGEDGHQLPEFMSSSPKSKPHCSPAPITFPISSPLHPAPSSFSFSVTSPPPSVHAPTTFTITSSPPAASSSTESVQAPTSLAPVSAEDDLFPVQLEGKSKKRKSGEDLNGGSEDAGESKHVKRSRGVAAKTDSLRSAQERRGVSQRAARSVHAVTSSSLRKTKPAVAVQAKRPNSRVLSQGASSVKRCGSESVTKAKVVAVAQSKLTFVKPPQTALPRHPMPFAAKNMFYDERWIEKQERGFAWWINYVLTPDDFKVNTEVAKTVFGELISLESNSDILGLAMFILQRLLWNPDIAAEFRHPRVPHLYKDGHEEALSRFTLKKLLLLVCFLDRAKESRLIEHDPCLFCLDAEFKATKDLLLAFSRDFLSGEGILPRHLSYLGLPVSHVQTPLNEFSFAVNNLAVDLKCGIRLVRVMELLVQDWSLSAKLRLPAISRLQKVHNVDLALQVLTRKGIDLKDEHGAVIESRDIVDGHREKTLSLLWKILFSFHVEVENFTVSFSDGRVLCYLIHHYHPGLLPGASISTSTTQTVECSQRGRLELNCSSGDSDCSLDAAPTGSNGPDSSPLVFKELLENEKSNFRLVNAAVSSLGGVPAMISPADMSNTIPSEKVVMSYLSFLCARLLDLRNETRAARVIQAAWRKHRLQKDLQIYEERNQAAGKIQLAAFWRGYSARNRMRLEEEARIRAVQHKAATVIQAQWRTLFTLRAYQRLRYYTIIVQAQWRMRRAAAAYEKTYWAATVIQKHSRATALSRRDRERYLLLKASVVKIQQAFRRWKARKVRKQNRAAAVIQAAFKKWFKAQTAEKAAAAVAIQAWYRMQLCFCRYNKMRRSALLIQAHFRGHEQRRRFQTLKLRRNSALVIQSAFRGHTVRKEFLKLRCAAVIIQRRWRASTRRDAQREAFVRIRCAAVKIQAAYRGQAARELLRKQLKAATAIQAAFRSHAAQKRYLVVRKAAGLIQQRYRARALALKAKKEYDAVRRAAIVLQASWRGRTDRKKVGMWHQRATLIQTCFRRHKAQTEYRCKKAAAVVIQRRYKAFLVGKETRSVYIQQRRAFIALQAGFRGMRVRTELRKKHQAATIIQSVVRMFLCRKRYVLLQSAAIIIQCRYRALLLGREQRSEFRNVKRAAVNIQAALRGFRVRTDLKKRHDAARMIQAQFRMYRIRRAYLATRCAVLTIQERYRANVLRDELMQAYKIKRAAAVVIQAAYRGHRARRRVTEMHQAARIIQRKFLATRARTQFLAIRAAALVCQQRYRAALLARKVKLDYVSKRRAVVCLQAAYRGYAVRKQLHKWQRAAVAIQSHFRKHQQRSSYKKLLWACSVLQTRYRANKQMRAEVQALCAKRNATVVLQAAYRGMKSRQRVKQHQNAACVIQAAFRACCERRRYLALRSCVIKLQLRYRANAAAKTQIKQYKQIRRATVTLQAAEQVKYQAMRLSTIIIQRRYRALLLQQHDRETFLKTKRCAVVLQAAFRGSRVRKDIAKMHKAASIIQAKFRQHRQQTAFRQQRWAARILQQRFRAQRRKQLEVKRYQEVRKAAAVLQAAYRGMKARQMVQQRHRAAGVIQRAFKAHRQRRKYSTLKSSALTIQKRYRATVTAKKQMQQYKRIRSAAVIVQAAYRGLRQRYRATIQARAERNRYIRQQQAAVTLQRFCRAWSARQQVLKAAHAERRLRFTSAVFHHLRAIKIQRALRAHWALESAKKQIRSVIIIQRWVRAMQQRRRFQEDRRKVITAQRAVRSWLARRHKAASVLQQAVRKLLFIRRRQRVLRGITKAQALWRGHRSRQLNDDMKLSKLRLRLRKVSADVQEEDKLCNKTTSALEYLLRYKHFSYIIQALKNLETATRLSPVCCERLVESGAINVIFTQIRCCNRSLPCMEVITLSVQILLNLSKYHKTVEAVYSVENSVETLLDLLQRYRDKAGDKVAEKGGSIFTKTCFLIALLLQDPHRVEEVKKIPHALDRLCSIYKLTARKHKLDAERNIVKLKMNASVNGSVLATPRKSPPVPKFSPDWVLTRNNLKEIVHPLRAIQMVADTLSIVL
uniref:Asp (Abnormal spindle)-like, microcephaly associated n=1 Tax=Nothobranchius furzeri TaxID=105023 RepID=A0A1A8UL38_NOTFU